MKVSTFLTAAFFGVALAKIHPDSCRQCDCTITYSKGTTLRTAVLSTAQVETKAKAWLNKIVTGGDYDDFQLGVSGGASCPADTTQTCDSYSASFKAWRLCGNGGSYSCTKSDTSGSYNLKCDCTKSVACKGTCTKGCPAM